MNYLKQLNDVYTRYDLKGHENAFCREIPEADLRFFNALYFEVTPETKKHIYCEYQTKLNLIDLCKKYKHHPSLQDILRGSIPENEWNQLEKELDRYNPFACLKDQKRQDKIDITTLPDNVELLFHYHFAAKYFGSYSCFLFKEPILLTCPYCGRQAQVYYQAMNYCVGKYYAKSLCRECHKVFDTDLSGFTFHPFKQAAHEKQTAFIAALQSKNAPDLFSQPTPKPDWISFCKPILQQLKNRLEENKITDITQMDNALFGEMLYDCLVQARLLSPNAYATYHKKGKCRHWIEMNQRFREAKLKCVEEYLHKLLK